LRGVNQHAPPLLVCMEAGIKSTVFNRKVPEKRKRASKKGPRLIREGKNTVPHEDVTQMGGK